MIRVVKGVRRSLVLPFAPRVNPRVVVHEPIRRLPLAQIQPAAAETVRDEGAVSPGFPGAVHEVLARAIARVPWQLPLKRHLHRIPLDGATLTIAGGRQLCVGGGAETRRLL